MTIGDAPAQPAPGGRAAGTRPDDLLVATGIAKQFGGIQALSELSLTVGRSEVVGIVGPNGAGKTTLFNCLLGLLHPDTGTVRFDGVRVDGLPVWKRSRLGIGRTYQRMELFQGMTVADHLLVADEAHDRGLRLWRDLVHHGGPDVRRLGRVEGVLSLLGLEELADRPVDGLPLGTARLVELGRAMMGAPKLLMLDEPSSGLDVTETRRLAGILTGVRQTEGTAIVLVEHDLALVRDVVDRLCVLDFGRLIADGTVDEVLEQPEVRRAYLGVGV